MTLPTDQRAQGNVRPLPLALISRELPPIYDQTDMINDDVAEQSIDDTAIGLNSEDVQLNFQLPGAGTMKYWVATYSSEGDKVTKIIAKSVSENARMKEILNFRALAKNATIMPRHQNIVDVLGVSLEDVPYFIYQEYIEYGTLKDFLMRNYQESSGGSSKQDTPDQEKTLHLTMFAADICEGMLFLKKQNCHHPGLAARKVLLSPSGRCKLYDFWPVDLAQDRVKQILDKKLPPLAWLAPETVFLGHFMEKSDIWNFGVVLWEIYSLGEIPFGGLTCAEIESKLRNKESLDQPLTCPGGIFGHMLATWNSAIDERPTF
ncbi:putative tyrosine kinase receptor Cad96Ca-like [Apostichopus japonicus]|uniref:Putative tyrosine kinase receptor Cad96Ca-like n=1 Tax=Stichopus japonicus TaxID=307972 RepID=A0A2G8JIE4_STIJA|nr:putative tyrosine kinase receptor Cad96Ca-like [Apostichopus japonicus]